LATLRQYWPLGAGEAYLVDNYRWLHARTDFEDDPKSPRLFFRLWLQVENFDSIA
jgi:alpha-ketoglutarate-dependent taurine dioxygenase